jgi:hypothetical protein
MSHYVPLLGRTLCRETGIETNTDPEQRVERAAHVSPSVPAEHEFVEIAFAEPSKPNQNQTPPAIQQGVVWGWHALSSQLPFLEGRDDNDPSNEKVMILITDGMNSYGDTSTLKESEYGAFGYASSGRLDYGIDSPNTKNTSQKLDEQTLKTCELAKAAGVSIFVIGYGVVPGSNEEIFLSSCSGGQENLTYYFNVSDQADIDAAFSSIKEDMLAISLAS